jgi:hypothetical protein
MLSPLKMPTQRSLIGGRPGGAPSPVRVCFGPRALALGLGVHQGALSRSIRFISPFESSLMTIGAMIAATKPASTTAAAMTLIERPCSRRTTRQRSPRRPRSMRVLTHQGYHRSSRSMASVTWEIVPSVSFGG